MSVGFRSTVKRLFWWLALPLAIGSPSNAFVIPLAAGAQAPRQWTLTPSARIADDTYPDGLSHTTRLSLGPSGQIFVPQMQDATVLVFDRAGHFVRRIGRRGTGPGEFQTVGFVNWLGDTLVVGDLSLRRISYFHPDGRFIRSRPDSGTGLQTVAAMSSTVGLTANGGLLVNSQSPGRPDNDQIVVALFHRPAGARQSSEIHRATVTSPVVQLDLSGDRRRSVFSPFQEYPLFGMSPQGDQLAVVDVPFPGGTTGEFVIRRYGAGGDLRQTKRVTFPAVRLSRAAADSLLEEHVTRLITAGRQPEADRALFRRLLRESLKVPGWFPAFDRIVLASDGNLWLRESANRNRWQILNSSGETIGWVRCDCTIAAATANFVWAIESDRLGDPPAITRYSIRR